MKNDKNYRRLHHLKNRQHDLKMMKAYRLKRGPEYAAYRRAKNRCNNPKAHNYRYYGAKGVKFLFTSFEHFIAMLGKRPTTKHSLGRFLDRGNYQPGNCRWMTREEQGWHKRANHNKI